MFNVDFFKIADKLKYKKLIYTGPIDKFFGYKFGKLQYRSIRFVFETHNLESSQPNSVINFPELRIPYTRITEFNKFYSKRSDRTVICKEFPGWDGEPAYPVINKRNINLLKRYTKEAKKLKQTVFIGRLAQYRYLDMDEIIKEALNVFQ